MFADVNSKYFTTLKFPKNIFFQSNNVFALIECIESHGMKCAVYMYTQSEQNYNLQFQLIILG
jgi:hypothetical protein